MNTKITACCLMILLCVPLVFLFRNDTIPSHGTTISKTIPLSEQTPSDSSDRLEIDQENLRLDHEGIQYTILFHENDTINVTLSMALQHRGDDVQPQAMLLTLTNGTKSIFQTTPVSFLFYVPSALLFDTTILGHRIAFGGRIFFKLLTRTRFHIGVSQVLTQEVSVKDGDIWYLTIADFNGKPDEILRITFRSLSGAASMQLVKKERHSNVGFYSALDNDFEGKYLGYKLPFLPFGLSIADNLHAEFFTTRGSILYFCSVGHVKGRLKVEAPNNKVYVNTKNQMAVFSYAGNLTGRWAVSASGFGVPWKHYVILFYLDADPHLTR